MALPENTIRPLPTWDDTPVYGGRLCADMQHNAPFIATKFQQRSDLGECIIQTVAPHIVCRVHAFRTYWEDRPGKDAQNAKQREVAEKQEQQRTAWLEERQKAFDNDNEAHRRIEAYQDGGEQIRELMSLRGMVYDEEFDEPRCIFKVPGYNIYLELAGCLDDIELQDVDMQEWERVCRRMTQWAPNAWDNQHRMAMRTRSIDWQPLKAWCEDFDPELRPWLPQKRGIGHTFIDPSRRPELLHSKAPSTVSKGQRDMDRLVKEEVHRMAKDGIAPENYGR